MQCDGGFSLYTLWYLLNFKLCEHISFSRNYIYKILNDTIKGTQNISKLSDLEQSSKI